MNEPIAFSFALWHSHCRDIAELLRLGGFEMPAKYTKKTPFGNDHGFTLLEIIAVLVILSILAVVAVPKYFDLQEQARDKAIQVAMAEGIGRINGYFAEQVLAGVLPDDIVYSATTLGTDLGDFSMAVETEGITVTTEDGTQIDGIQLTVDGKTDTPVEGKQLARTVPRPGI